MRKVMPDDELNRILDAKTAADRQRKAQLKAQDQINYEKYLDREDRLYQIEYNRLKRKARRRTLLPFLVFLLVVVSFLYILTYYPWLLGV